MGTNPDFFSRIVCVDGGQVIAFFFPSVTGGNIEDFISNCFLVVDKRSRPEIIGQLLVEAWQNGFRPASTLSSRDIQIFSLLVAGKPYTLISSVFSLSLASIFYIRSKVLALYGCRNLNVFLVVMFRLSNGLTGKASSPLLCSSLSALPAWGGLYA
ncbi:hypothetical protein I5481_21605 [Citrobacter freundii]|nr:hypothetical protein [Citrobacter freundii]